MWKTVFVCLAWSCLSWKTVFQLVWFVKFFPTSFKLGWKGEKPDVVVTNNYKRKWLKNNSGCKTSKHMSNQLIDPLTRGLPNPPTKWYRVGIMRGLSDIKRWAWSMILSFQLYGYVCMTTSHLHIFDWHPWRTFSRKNPLNSLTAYNTRKLWKKRGTNLLEQFPCKWSSQSIYSLHHTYIHT